MSYLGLILGALGVIFITILWNTIVSLIWRPYVITNKFRKQGVKGPEYKFLIGCLDEIRRLRNSARETEMDIYSHDIVPRILPHYYKWLSQYGRPFLYWIGTKPRLCITDVELVKQILSNKFGFYPKPKANGALIALLGKGLVLSEGSEWAQHKRIVGPAFTMDKLKMMTKQMAECTRSMLDSWCDQIGKADGQHNAIQVNSQFQMLTADIISHAAFGSSFVQGKEVFLAQRELQKLFLATFLSVQIPGYNYLPTKSNILRWKLDQKLKNTLVNIIQGRLNTKDSSYGNDLLGLMMESTEKEEGTRLTTNEIIDECKTFFFAGHETTSHLLTWTIFLLSMNIEWQERLREEVMRECDTEIPDADSLSKFKLMTMVIFEVLRLYCPVLLITREASNDMKLGDLMIPKGTTLTVPFAVIHRDKELWGDDVDKFNPLRFENGINKAAMHPNAMLAFSMGPRACIGQNFAMLESKTVIAMILKRFTFSLSPDYKHKPASMITLQPQNGLPINFKPLVT